MKSKMKKLVIITIMIALVVMYFFYITNKTSPSKKNTEKKDVSEVTKLLNKDLDSSYPKTPREVVKLYNRIIKCYYGEKYTDDELKLLAVQAQKLMDKELIEHNDFNTYYNNLCEDIEEYKENERTISSYVLDSSADIEYKNFKEAEYAFVRCLYYTHGKEGTAKVPQQYILRKDDSGKWKMVYWEKIEEDNDNE